MDSEINNADTPKESTEENSGLNYMLIDRPIPEEVVEDEKIENPIKEQEDIVAPQDQEDIVKPLVTSKKPRKRWAVPNDRQSLDQIVSTVNLLERTMSGRYKRPYIPDPDYIKEEDMEAQVLCPHCHQMVNKRYIIRHMPKCFYKDRIPPNPKYSNEEEPEKLVECQLCYQKFTPAIYLRHLPKCKKAISEWRDNPRWC